MFLLPKLIQHIEYPSAPVRASAIVCVNQFLSLQSEPLMMHFFDSFIQAIYQRASDTEPDVRKRVCQALALVLETRPEALLPQLDNIVTFMLYCMEQEDETVALEACEFWLSFAEQPELREHLDPYVQRYPFWQVLFIRIGFFRCSSNTWSTMKNPF